MSGLTTDFGRKGSGTSRGASRELGAPVPEDGGSGPRAQILVVDDEPEMRCLLEEILLKQGFEVLTAQDGVEAVEKVESDPPTAVIMDVKMPRRDGLDALTDIKRRYPQVPVIMITAHGDIPVAVESMRRGAQDYLTKPFRYDDILMSVRRAVERRSVIADIEAPAAAPARHALFELMGSSQPIKELVVQVEAVARSGLTTLIHGETGTGKELVARAIHDGSARRRRPFVALDCGAIPETLIEAELFGHERGAFTGADRAKNGHVRRASGGTLFLDEVVNLPLGTQAKLLRVLQERQVQPLGGAAPVAVDIRVIAASNVLLKEEMLAGRFRQDLYYRLSEFMIVLPAIRHRSEDVPFLAARFLKEAIAEFRGRAVSISEEALDALVNHPWPGNVRELRNVVRRAVVLAPDVIRTEHLAGLVASPGSNPVPAGGGQGLSLKERAEAAAAEAERAAICETLKMTRGNKSEAARLLKTDYKTLHVKMRRYTISAHDYRAG